MTTTGRTPDWLDPALFPFESRSIEVGGNRIHYVDEGSGPILLFLHGNPTWSFLYRHLIRALRSDFRCIALDTPGFGLSRGHATYGYTPREHSIVVEQFVDALELRDLTLMVQDWGGPIGLGFAGRRPDLIRALVIGNCFAWPAQKSRGLSSFSRLFGSRLGRYLITRHNALARWLIPAGTNRKLSDGELAAYLGPFPTPRSRVPMWVLAREIRRSKPFLEEVEAGLARLANLPALIVWGGADGAFRKPDRDRFRTYFPKAQRLDLATAKHFIQENAPDTIASTIRDWLGRL